MKVQVELGRYSTGYVPQHDGEALPECRAKSAISVKWGVSPAH